jgi:ArsR family transcriptional regulator, arsenate/arsenite/antimonite-responsive transcriptional repressor / arsenate reductase (thioredoxin)
MVREPPAFLALAGHPLRWRLLSELAGSDPRVRELVGLTGEPQNLVSYHLRLLRDAGLVAATRSSFDGRDSYYHLDLDRCAAALAGAGAALHPGLRMAPAPVLPQPAPPVAVVFVCTGNSARSPIAEALLRQRGGRRVKVTSAGTVPKPQLHAHAARLLRDEYGIDIAQQRPRDVHTLTGRGFDYLVTLCDKARETAPDLIDHRRRIHWSIPDPAVAGYPAFARAAADIHTRIGYLIPMLNNRNPEEAQP